MIKFVLDSASDITPDEVKESSLPITIVPLSIAFGDEMYKDGVTMDRDRFYQLMEEHDELPKSSQPSPELFYNVFEENLKDNTNELIYLALASGLSGTFQSANIAKSMLTEDQQKRLYIIDTGTASAGIQILLHHAEMLVEEGNNAKYIAKQLENKKQGISAFVLLNTLENVRKGGRITDIQGKIGELLNIKPLLKIQHGAVVTVGKFRGSKRGVKRLAEIINDWKDNHDDLYVVHSFPSKEEVIKMFGDKLSFASFKNIHFTKFGSVIGTHAGREAIGVLLYK